MSWTVESFTIGKPLSRLHLKAAQWEALLMGRMLVSGAVKDMVIERMAGTMAEIGMAMKVGAGRPGQGSNLDTNTDYHLAPRPLKTLLPAGMRQRINTTLITTESVGRGVGAVPAAKTSIPTSRVTVVEGMSDPRGRIAPVMIVEDGMTEMIEDMIGIVAEPVGPGAAVGHQDEIGIGIGTGTGICIVDSIVLSLD